MIMDTPIRSVKILDDGRIDCEILHPIFGWIPFTANEKDSEVHGRLIWQSIKTNLK